MKLLVSFLLLVALAPISQGQESFGGAAPQALCSQARELGFGSTARYREQMSGQWSGVSTRRTLIEGEPAGASDVRYLVSGSEQQAKLLQLELRMRSYRGASGRAQSLLSLCRGPAAADTAAGTSRGAAQDYTIRRRGCLGDSWLSHGPEKSVRESSHLRLVVHGRTLAGGRTIPY
ncbi:MAG TPA: hypothetical protein EYP90_02285 [Chromatiaceae bacterium]|nr:hypothetical protein [Chromatiaceae bacterium]